ncbi:hypothetical protein JXA85_01555 [Candidatus Woesearchaeota archaeon]|nr:hypothetical protein [Candidatus Woesearchaeota archaeon]
MDIKPEWLGLTKQQLDLLLTVYELELNKIPVRASNIVSEYENRFNKKIQRQNLFSQLKPLLKVGAVEKKEKATYGINKNKIKSILDSRKNSLNDEMKNLSDFSKDLEKKFKKIITKPSKPIVTYLEPDLYMETIAALLNKANAYYADSPFPNITYTDSLFEGMNREKFVLNQRNNCFTLKKLKIHYITDLNIDLTFRRALKIFNNDGKRAYLECKQVIENLEKQIKEPNLDVRYLEVLPGPHMYIFEYDEPRDLILSLRGSIVPKGVNRTRGSRDPYGGVHIISETIFSQAKSIYLDSFNQAIKLNSARGRGIIEQVNEHLRKLYEGFKKVHKFSKIQPG